MIYPKITTESGELVTTTIEFPTISIVITKEYLEKIKEENKPKWRKLLDKLVKKI